MPHDAQPDSNVFRNIFSSAGADDPLALFEAETPRAEAEVAPLTPARASEHQALGHQAPEHRAPEHRVPDYQAPEHQKHLSTQAPEHRAPEHAISLEQVLDRLHYVSWAEAVAIVDALCGELSSGAGGDERVPELSQIAVTSAGAVVVAGGAPKGAPGPRLARILHALTAQGAIPAPLRLFVSKWVAFEEAHSIADFTKELEYFVRPDPEALIQAVYQRAAAATSAAPSPEPPALVETKPPAERAPRARAWRPSRRMAVAVAIALIAASLASVLAWLAVSGRPETASGLKVSDLLSSSAQAASQMASAVRQLAGLAPAPADATNTTSPGGDSVASNGSAAARTGPAGRAGARRDAAAPSAPLSVGRRSAEVARSLAAAVPPSTLPNATTPSLAPPGGGDTIAEVVPIYSSADVDVTPPQMQYPQLPPPLLSGVQAEVNTIEVIVTEAGTVERVRMLSPPRRMADMMLLSGAKTWRFEPASRGGQSVRYRLLLSWDATP